MIFTDLRYLAIFAGCWLTFVAVPRHRRSLALALWGLLFYALYAGVFVVAAVALTVATLFVHRRWQAYVVAAAVIAVLTGFKIAEATVRPDAAADIIIPLGLSYLSFELLHIVFERRRGRITDIGVADLLAYAFFLPCRIAGPIRRFPQFVSAVAEAQPSAGDVYQGIVRILIGLAKKLIIADTLALTVAELQAVRSSSHAWTVVLAYGFQIFFDFSAYSDLAIGFSRLLGISVPENFNYPYFASNIREFWNRWHITLSSWVRDYVFMPTGRRLFGTGLRPYPAAIAAISYVLTFAVVGAWHGVTPAFLMWGLYHGFLLAAHHVIQARMPAAIASSAWYRSAIGTSLGCAVTFFFVTLGWVPFMTDSARAGELLRLMLGGGR